MQQEPLVKLLGYILPSEFAEYFDLIDVKEEERNGELLLHRGNRSTEKVRISAVNLELEIKS